MTILSNSGGGEGYVPLEVSCFQAKVALDHFELLSSVELLIAQEDTPTRIKLAWNNGATFKRYSDMILWSAEKLELSSEQIDELFIYASKVE